MFLLDTNIVSELMREIPHPVCIASIRRLPSPALYTTTIVQAEIRTGILRLPPGRKRDHLTATAHQIFTQTLAGRILPFDEDAAEAYAHLVSKRLQQGRPIETFDAQIAAIAIQYQATLITRNIKHFLECGVPLLNPWDSPTAAST